MIKNNYCHFTMYCILHSVYYIVNSVILSVLCFCVQDSELALLAAQQYYVDHGGNLVAASLRQNLPEYIPQRSLRLSGAQHWETLVTEAFKQVWSVFQCFQLESAL